MDPPLPRRFAAALLTDDPKTRIRLRHWCLIFAVYLACAAALSVFIRCGELTSTALFSWLGLVVVVQLSIYAAIRSGWSRTTADPPLTLVQIVFGIGAVMFAYTVTGEARSASLFPLMILLIFGAFSVSWQRIAALTVLALVALASTMAAMHALQPARYSAVVDLSNFLVDAVLLPASSAVARTFGTVRARLRQQRAELEDALARIQDLATRDDLTGLFNRRHVQSLMAAEALRHRRGGQPFAVALLDLDHFKRINDVHGHAAGDDALRCFAREALAGLREIDTVARWGGEEFLVLMPGIDDRAAVSAVNRLRQRIERVVLVVDDGELRFTFSAGAAAHDGRCSIAETVSRADEALYAAKAAGRNRVEAASAPTPAAPEPLPA